MDKGGTMIERVRAVLVTPDNCLLAIRRDRPDRATYWVLPGGHVDPEDQNIEAALSREISEDREGRDLFTLPDLRSAPAAQVPRGT